MTSEENSLLQANQSLENSLRANKRLKIFRLIALTLCFFLSYRIYSKVNQDIKAFDSASYQAKVIAKLQEEYSPRLSQLQAHARTEFLRQAKEALHQEYQRRNPFLEQELIQTVEIDSYKIYQILKQAMENSIAKTRLELLKKYPTETVDIIIQNIQLKADRMARNLQYSFSTETERIQTQIESLKDSWQELDKDPEFKTLNEQKAKKILKQAIVKLSSQGVL